MVERSPETGGRPAVSLVRTRPEAHRPLTRLHAAVQRWRSQFADPLWLVRLLWIHHLQAEHACDARLVRPDQGCTAWLEIDAGLTDEAAESAVMRALADLQVEELRLQCAAVLQGRRPRARPDPTPRHQVA